MKSEIFQQFMMIFWGSLVAALVVSFGLQSFFEKLLKRSYANTIKKSLINLFTTVSILPQFFLYLSFFKTELHLFIVRSYDGFIESKVQYFAVFLSKVVNSDLPLLASAGLGGLIGAFLILPKFFERIQNSLLKHSLYLLFSGGLYLPYFVLVNLIEPLIPEKIKRGTQIIHSSREGVKTLKTYAACKNKGIKIHPEIRIPVEQETKHILAVATIGAGKTQLIFPIVDEILKRNDRILIYDRKGDYTEAYGENSNVVIISPFDRRGKAWNVGRDINTEILAEEFASALVPVPIGQKDPVWIEAAQDLLLGVIKALQARKGSNWCFADLNEILEDKDKIIDLCAKHHPGALQNLGNGNDDRQTTSVLLSLRTGVRRISNLAKAWPLGTPVFSLIEWIRTENHPVRVVIMGGNPRYSGLDNLLVTQIFNLFYSEILSLSDSRTRKLWSINDEQGSQPKIPLMLNGLTEGRSKGLRIVSAIQSVSQIRAIYGRERAEEWFNSFGTLFAGRVGDYETAAYLAKSFGTNRIEKTTMSLQSHSEKSSKSIQNTNEPALLDSDFLNIPNPSFRGGIEFWLRISGWPACKLKYPIIATPKKYLAKVPKTWLKPLSNNTVDLKRGELERLKYD